MRSNVLLERLLEPLQVAGLTVDRDGRVAYLNDAARALLGATLDADVQGTPLHLMLGDPEGGGIDEILGQAFAGKPWQGEMSVLIADTERVRLGLQATPVRGGDDASGDVLGAVVTIERLHAVSAAEHRLGDRLARLAHVTGGLMRADDLDAVTTVMVDDLADAAGATVASVALLESPDTLVLVRVRGGRPGVASRWHRFPTVGTPVGDALVEDRIVVLRDDEIRQRYPSLERAAEGERSMVCMPLKVASQPIGALGLSFPGFREFDSAELAFIGSLADTAAQALERVQSAAEAADQASKLEFLARTSEELGASLDYESTLRAVAQSAVPWFADWCSISLAQDGVLRTFAVAHVDPAMVSVAEEYLERYPTDPDSSAGSYAVLRSGRSEIIEITDELLVAAVTDPEQLAMLRGLNFRSALTVPLKVKDRVLGVATWVSGDEGRRFTEADRSFGEDLGRRAAIAIDNAQLHSEVREVAERLQRAVLPLRLPDVPGWELAASYRSAGHSQVGGDFYDVVPLEGGRFALFVGDVMGRGVQAAAAMAQMRSAVRTLIAVDSEPRTVMHGLDRLFTLYDMAQLVTVVYAVVDPGRGEVEVASAGHLPPLLVHPDESVDRVAGAIGILLGAGGGKRTTVTAPFRAGDALLLYTDGLVERRGEDIDDGINRLAKATGILTGRDLQSGLDLLVDEVADVTKSDDIAALMIRWDDPQKPMGSPA